MKSLVLALMFFGVLVFGCYDVKPFRAVRKLVRRPSKAVGAQTGPIAHEAEPPPPEARPLSRRYR